MAVYKVPQDVEAEDKLLGPFSFRQFVYLLIAGGSAFIGWLLWSIAPFLVVIPIPIIIFFVVLALPLRKDQPMEIYLLAVAQFLLKPKKRLWSPDGIISLVQITLPQQTNVQLTKDLTQGEAVDRLAYLAQVMDTRGWAARGVDRPVVNQSMTEDVAMEVQSAEDILDTNAGVSRSFDSLIEKRATEQRQKMMDRLQNKPTQTSTNPYDTFLSQSQTDDTTQPPAGQNDDTPAPSTYTAPQQPQEATNGDTPSLRYNPYPTSIRQQVIQPLSQQPKQEPAEEPKTTQESTSTLEVSPDIINLANNPDLSISTIANEARRIQERQLDNGEVEISLR